MTLDEVKEYAEEALDKVYENFLYVRCEKFFHYEEIFYVKKPDIFFEDLEDSCYAEADSHYRRYGKITFNNKMFNEDLDYRPFIDYLMIHEFSHIAASWLRAMRTPHDGYWRMIDVALGGDGEATIPDEKFNKIMNISA